MIWLTWRQFRTQAAVVYAAIAAFAVVLAVTVGGLPDAAAGALDQLTRGDRNLFWAGIILVALAPALVGAFFGAPLVARELESGTHRLVWNQSVTRTRWLATKLGVTALAAAAAIGLLTLAVTWWSGSLDGATGTARGGLPARLTPVSFGMRGIVPVAYAVFALVLGVAAGLVLRRVVPAMAVTLAVFAFVQIAVPLWVRPHLIPPVRQSLTISDHFDGIEQRGPDGGVLRVTVRTGSRDDWLLSEHTIDPAGVAIDSLPQSTVDCLPLPSSPQQGKDTLLGCMVRLDTAGYRQQVVYQPASRFWALQWAETGLFLGVSALLAWFSFWWIRRRLS